MFLNIKEQYLKITYYLLLLLPVCMVFSRAAADFIVVFIAIFFIFNIRDNISLLKNKFVFYFLLFYGWVSVVTFFYAGIDINSLKSISYLRFLLFLLGSYIIFQDKKKFKLFLMMIIFVVSFVEIDILIQFLFGKNIFGFSQKGVRLSGVFGEELIAGSFINKFFPLCVFLLHYLINNFRFKNYIIVVYIFLSLSIVFLTGERSAFFMSVFSLIFYFLYLQNIKKIFLVSILIFIISLISFLSFNQNYFNRYVKQNFIQFGLQFENKKNSIEDSHYFRLWYTAVDDFLNKPYFGYGLNYQKKSCASSAINPSYFLNLNVKKTKCVHPHNYYLDIITTSGIIGLFLFIFFIRSIFKHFDFLIRDNKVIENFNLISKGSAISIALFFWPLQTTGSFFNNLNSIFLFTLIFVFFVSKQEYRVKS